MPVATFHLLPDGRLVEDIDPARIPDLLKSGQGLLWVDIQDPGPKEGAMLREGFGFHPVAIDVCLEPRPHPAKVQRFDSSLFLLLHGVDYSRPADIVATTELALFLGPGYVVSCHHGPLVAVDAVVSSLREHPAAIAGRADFLAHALIDALAGNILPTIDALRDVAEDLEEAILRDPRPAQLDALIRLKRSTLRLSRVVGPQVGVLARLGRGEFDLVGPDASIFFLDVHDQLLFMQGLIESTHQRAEGAVTTYMSSVAVRQNETMRTLSIVASIFLPLSLIAGIYGMNFENMPELEVSWAYFAVVGFMAVVVALGTLWLTWRRWVWLSRQAATRVRSFVVEPQRLAEAMRPARITRYVSHARPPGRIDRSR